MARFQIRFLTGTIRNAEFSVGPNQGLFIGASKENHVRIPDDPTIAERHARMWQSKEGKIYFEDLDSAAGSRVNGKRIARVVRLREGDRVSLGESAAFDCQWWDEFARSRVYSAISRIWLRTPPPVETRNRRKLIWLAVVSLQTLIVVFLAIVSYMQPTWLRELLEVREQRARPLAAAAPARQAALFSDEFIWDEVIAIATRFGEPPPAAMDSAFIAEIRRAIKTYSSPENLGPLVRRQTEVWDTLTTVLRRHSLPQELAYIVWVESGFRPNARSPAGAVGLWQFMPVTAKTYQLKIDPRAGIDERMDIGKSSEAAARYIEHLLAQFGSEHYLLAIAAYNVGQSRMKREQMTALVGEIPNPNFWAVRDNLPAETREYVPRVLGAMIVGRNLGLSKKSKEHGGRP